MKHLFTAALLCSGATMASADQIDWRSPTLMEARAQMFHPSFNYLANQHMDQLFASRDVPAGDNSWALASSPVDLSGAYMIGGEMRALDDALEWLDTNALVVLKDGAIAYETYRNGSDEDTQFMTFSVAKSYVASLVGFALQDGLIEDLSDPITKYLPEMKGTGYDGPTIDDVLRMRSGADWLEVYEFGSETQLTKVHDGANVGYAFRWCDYAANESVPGKNAPGAAFNYSTLDTSVLGCLVERVVGKTGADYMSEKLWKPAGMTSDAYWIMDGPEGEGREFFGAGFAATARDHARYGQLILQQGAREDGTQIIPADWVKAMTTAGGIYDETFPGLPYGYGYQWWTLRGTPLFAAQGLHNQYIYVDPVNSIVIFKASYTPEPIGRGEEMYALFGQITERLLAK